MCKLSKKLKILLSLVSLVFILFSLTTKNSLSNDNNLKIIALIEEIPINFND